MGRCANGWQSVETTHERMTQHAAWPPGPPPMWVSIGAAVVTEQHGGPSRQSRHGFPEMLCSFPLFRSNDAHLSIFCHSLL